MIIFNKEKRLFHIYNNSISYYIYLNYSNQLEKIYFGKKINIENIEAIRINPSDNWFHKYYDNNIKEELFSVDNYSPRSAFLEVGRHGLDDNRYSPIIIKKYNGITATNFTYIEHRIYKGYPIYDSMPYVHGDNIETIEFLLKDEYSDCYLKMNLSICLDKDIIFKNYEIINKGKDKVNLLRVMSMQLDLPHMEYDLHYFSGKWGKERGESIYSLNKGNFEVSSNYGRSSHEFNPFVYLTEKNANYEKGEVIGFNFLYSGNFKFHIETDFLEHAHIVYGINDYDFNWLLGNEETFITPQSIISYSYNGIDKMSQAFHRFIKENIITFTKDNQYKSILFNSWEGTMMDFNTGSILEYVDQAKNINAELFVLDDGWFGKRNDEWSSLGDWFVNKDKIDLKKVIDYVHSKGMKFGLWFEPEMISPKSELYLKHPEYALGYGRLKQSILRHQFMLDLTSDEVVDCIYNQMVEILDNYQIDYIKWDHNRDIKEHYSQFLDSDRQGEVFHRIVLGYYKLISKLVNRYPSIMFEGCASGGGRFDLGTLYYCPQIWASDESDPLERMFIQYNTSLGYPLSSIGSHANNSKVSSYRTKCNLALFGTYGYEMNPTKLLEEEKKEIIEVGDIYKKYHNSVINNGILYHLSSPENSNVMSMQCVSIDKKKSLVLYMNKRKEHFKYRFLKLKGLDKNKKYLINDIQIMTGEELMNIGINLSQMYFEEVSSLLFVLLEVN